MAFLSFSASYFTHKKSLYKYTLKKSFNISKIKPMVTITVKLILNYNIPFKHFHLNFHDLCKLKDIK